jgi:hypothetical protein
VTPSGKSWNSGFQLDFSIVHQDQPLVEYHQKTNRGWLLSEIAGIEATLQLPELELQLPFSELYVGVDWLPDSGLTEASIPSER